MRAPVYRNIEAQNTFLGLTFPTEVGVLMGGVWGLLLTMAFSTALVGSIALYVGIRVLMYGRPPLFLRHWVGRALRRALSAGRLSAAARAKSPKFPYGPYQSRDLHGGDFCG
jgi:hypothetical protein